VPVIAIHAGMTIFAFVMSAGKLSGAMIVGSTMIPLFVPIATIV
jgi:hypothetical protein